ncbi:MAG: group II intron reverse transcriptase/maturase [Verrucomicrobiota bacterium]
MNQPTHAKASSSPKQIGAATAAATETGAEQQNSGSVGLRSSESELERVAKEGEPKVLNDKLMEQVLSSDNLRAAYLKVKANQGAAGVDGMGTEELGEFLKENWPGLKTKILEGRYKPSPVRGVTIPKSGGGERHLGIPTVLDRMVQQAIHQVLDSILDPAFSESSFGYRRGRSAHDAVRKAKRHVVEEGKRWVIDIDIRGYFDNINHDILMRELASHINDKRVLHLVGKYLRSGVFEDGRVKRSAKGTPQGGPLSPLLGNLYLDALDKELETRGVSFCRYADDITIYAKSERSAHRIYANIVKWITRRLKLEVNEAKSGVRPPEGGSFLGFRIDERDQIALSEKSVDRFKEMVREHWDERRCKGGKATLESWQKRLRGWVGYFRLSERSWDWEDLEGWLRRHMRKWFWQRWHNQKGRRNALKRLGVRGEGLKLASSSRRAWRVAKMLNVRLPNGWLREKGFWVPSDLVGDRV